MALYAIDLHFRARLASRDHGLRYLGPTIRGLFGYVFKRAVCLAPHGQCPRCLLRRACPYPAIFEGLPPADRRIMRKYPAVPQPFVLLVAEPDEWWGAAHELRWGIRLFGDAARFTPYVVAAFAGAGAYGVGPRRVPYALESVHDACDGQVLWSAGDEVLREPPSRLISGGATLPTDGAIRWRFHTPVHLREGGREQREFDGLSLVIAGRRRATLLDEFFGNVNDGAYAGSVAGIGHHGSGDAPDRLDSSEFVTREAHLRPWAIERFSGRQRRMVPLSGSVGEVVIEGPWSRAGAWMMAVPEIHLGKYASFGFGRVTWEVA